MKKEFFKLGFLALFVPLMVASCASDSDPSVAQAGASVAKTDSSLVIDLNDFTYAKAKAALESGSPVVLKDSSSSIAIAAFKKLQNVSLNISGETVSSYEGNDSVSASLSNGFIAFKIGNAGSEKGYASYASTDGTGSATTRAYAQISTVTRSSTGASAAMLSASGSSLKINISQEQKSHGLFTQGAVSGGEDNVEVSAQEQARQAALSNTSSIMTRASNYTFPRNKTVNIYLLVGKNATAPTPLELSWQVDNARKSINDIFSGDQSSTPNLVFTTQNCDFSSTNDSGADLSNFLMYVYNNSSRFPGASKDVFILVREWWWGSSVLGCAYTNTYNINRFYNTNAVGVSQVSFLNSTVLAHELGHIFGVTGHSTTPWYRMNRDLMNATCYAWVGCYHRTDIDQGSSFRNAIYNNLKQK